MKPSVVHVVYNRNDTLTYYSVDDSGNIDCPGIFHGQPIWVPYFWNLAGDDIGHKIRLGMDIHLIDIEQEEFIDFPELNGHASVKLWMDDDGLVHGELVSFELRDWYMQYVN